MADWFSQSDRVLLDRFNALLTPSDVAAMLDVPLREYNRYVYDRKTSNHICFHIPKRSGGTRRIEAPILPLFLIQKKLCRVFYAVYSGTTGAHGCAKGRSILTNASLHSGKRWVFRVDLRDFFTTITFPRIFGLLKAPPLNRNYRVAAPLAQACCFNGHLPQGAPTSPVLSNMICVKLDGELQRFADNLGVSYSRYVDDICFSFDLGSPPKELLQWTGSVGAPGASVGRELQHIIQSNGFQINEHKTRLMHTSQRQVVTGLKVNEFPNPNRRLVKQIRAMLHAWERWGLAEAELEHRERYRHKHRMPGRQAVSFRDVLQGKIEFLRMVRGNDDRNYGRFRDHYRRLAKARPPDAVFVLENDECQGTAFFLRDIGLVTAAHVVAAGTKTFNSFIYRAGRPLEKIGVEVIRIDADRDIAILRPAVQDLESHQLQAADDDQLEIGAPVALLGFPNYGPGGSITVENTTITSKAKRHGARLVTIGATVREGHSGGPLIDLDERVIGVAVTGLDYENGVVVISEVAQLAQQPPID